MSRSEEVFAFRWEDGVKISASRRIQSEDFMEKTLTKICPYFFFFFFIFIFVFIFFFAVRSLPSGKH